MSVNVYLKNSVESLEGFEIVERKEKNGEKWYTYSLPGIKLFRDKGRYYCILHELNEQVSDLVKPFVEEISFYELFPRIPSRICGVYRFKDAEAEIDTYLSESYAVRITGKSMQSIQILYRAIRSGRTMPASKDCWGNEQIEQIVPKWKKIIRRLLNL